MKLCIAIVCTVIGVVGCKSKNESANTNEPAGSAVRTPTVEPAGSAAPAPAPHAGHQGSGSAAATPPAGTGPDCGSEFDHGKNATAHMACVECEKHRGMGAMEADCKNAIPKPWK